MGRAASDGRSALPRVRAETAVEAEVGPRPPRGRRWNMGRLHIDERRRRFVARQGRGRRPENDGVRWDIAKSAPPPRAAPGTGAFLQLDLGALRDPLHHSRLAAGARAHRNRRSRHRQLSPGRRRERHANCKPKAKMQNRLHILAARQVGPFGPKAGSTRK